MPYVVNGIGTWYWGKSNVHVNRGTCDQCGRTSELTSYDTRTYFVLFFVPLVPLTRKRVVEQCSVCKKHRVIKYCHWRRGLKVELPEIVEAFRRAPNDAEAGNRAVAAAVTFQDESAVDAAAETAGSSLARKADWHALLGHAYVYFSRYENAEQAYRMSLQIKDDADVREALAQNLLWRSRPDEAWNLIGHILTEKKTQRMGLPVLVAEAYQTWGMHDAALTVLDECAAAFPELTNDAEFERMRKTALKYKDTEKPIKPRIMAPPRTRARRGRSLGSYVPIAIAGAVLLFVVAGFVIASRQEAAAREVYVVNGLSVPYQLSINGMPKNLRPYGVGRMRLSEGDIHIKVLSEDVPIPDQTCRITTGFFTRVFVDHLFVINPDRTALLAWEAVEYSENPAAAADPDYRLHFGDLLLSMTDVDYPFQKFPESVLLPSAAAVRRTRLAHLDEFPCATAAAVIANELGQDAMETFIHRTAKYGPDDAVSVAIAVQLFEPSDARDLLEDLRRARPIRVEAHRAYQSVVDQRKPDHDLVTEYRALLADAPDSPERLYLLARVLDNEDEAESLLQRAASGEKPCAYALNALAFNRLAGGTFDEALDLGRRASAASPDNLTFHSVLGTALEALGRFDEALQHHQSAQLIPAGSALNEAYYLMRLGRSDEVGEWLDAMVKDESVTTTSNAAAQHRRDVEASLAYAQGDIEQMVALCRNTQDVQMRLASALTMSDLRASRVALKDLPADEGYDSLLVSLAARAAQENADADELLKAAAGLFRKGDSRLRKVAAWLAGETVPDLDEALRIGLMPDEKRIVMTALGVKYPEHRERYFDMARTLNFNRRFPHLFIRSMIEQFE